MGPKEWFFRRLSDWITVLSHLIWILAGLFAVGGVVSGWINAHIEAQTRDASGLYTMILFAVLLTFSGIAATVAAKLEAEENSKKKAGEGKK